MPIFQRTIPLLWVFITMVSIGQGQTLTRVVPVPDELKHAVTLDLGGNTPAIGFSYHQSIVQFTTQRHPQAGSVDVVIGAGYVPSFCLFSCSPASLSTHHSLLYRWGRRILGEVGYAGFLAQKGIIGSNTYAPGALMGVRYSPKTLLIRLYLTGLYHYDDKAVISASGDLISQRVNYLGILFGFSIGQRF